MNLPIDSSRGQGRVLPELVQRAFDAWPVAPRARLLEIRELIFDTADATPGVGHLTEALRWGEPAYLTNDSRSGSMIRLGWKAGDVDRLAIYFHCRTSLVEEFRSLFPDVFGFEGRRAITLKTARLLPVAALGICSEAP